MPISQLPPHHTRVPTQRLGEQMIFISPLRFHACFLLISVPSAHVSVLFCCYFGCLGEKIEFIWASPEVSCAVCLQNWVFYARVPNNLFKIALIIQLHQAKVKQLCSFHCINRSVCVLLETIKPYV